MKTQEKRTKEFQKALEARDFVGTLRRMDEAGISPIELQNFIMPDFSDMLWATQKEGLDLKTIIHFFETTPKDDGVCVGDCEHVEKTQIALDEFLAAKRTIEAQDATRRLSKFLNKK